jgi:alpha-L-arabinofuranosidase
MKYLKTILSFFLVILFLAVNLFSQAETQSPEEIFAQKYRVKLWSFETNTTEGWHGVGKWAKACSVTTDPKYVTEGKYALKVDATTSIDWNQDACVNDGPFLPEINKLVEFSFDLFVPEESMKGLEYLEIYLVFSSRTNNWYQLKKQVTTGKQRVSFKVDPTKIKEDMWHIYLVINNSQPLNGPIYFDNFIGRIYGQPGTVEGKIIDKDTKEGVKDAYVVIGDSLTRTDGDGNFKLTVSEDVYKLAIVAYGYKNYAGTVIVEANQTKKIDTIEILKQKEPKKKDTNISINVSKVIKTIDPHKLYGQNLAAWHKPDGYRDSQALEKLKRIGATFIRIPGGDYGNLYDWRTGAVYRIDGSVNWTPELNYIGGMVPFLKTVERNMGKAEVLPIINIMTPLNKTIEQRIDYAIEWLQDMKYKGLNVRYVEVGNEPDNKPLFPGPVKPTEGKKWYEMPNSPKVKYWWTSIDNYSQVFNLASYKIKKALPDMNLKIMGPCPMQPMNKQRLEGDPWKAQNDPKAPYWVERFLKNSGKYVDVVVTHEYPFWANNDARTLLRKPQETWPVYMPKYREWIKKYVNSIPGYENKYIEVALTEWNSGDEVQLTAEIENALFCADYLGEFIRAGGDLAFIWDLYTQKPGTGGGHGLLDAENDPTNRFSERGHYWVFDLYYNRFGTKMVECSSDNPNLSVFAALKDDNTLTVMAINKTRLEIASAKLNIDGFKAGSSAKVWQLTDKEYVWSKELYRPIVNTGPSEKDVNLGNELIYDFPPYSVTVLQIKK